MPGVFDYLGGRVASPAILTEAQPRDITPAMSVQLLENVVHVIFDCRGTKPQPPSDFLVGQVACNQRRDLSLAPGQEGVRGFRDPHVG